ncbi:MAG: carbamoyl-phosphate synthase domain-containing protein, partial [Vicingaceae bacterium]
MDDKAILLLEDGTVMHGNAAGLIGTTTGEICFNTGMT